MNVEETCADPAAEVVVRRQVRVVELRAAAFDRGQKPRGDELRESVVDRGTRDLGDNPTRALQHLIGGQVARPATLKGGPDRPPLRRRAQALLLQNVDHLVLRHARHRIWNGSNVDGASDTSEL